jgi:hypothetical protein
MDVIIRSVAGDAPITRRPAAHADNQQANKPTAPCMLAAEAAKDIQCDRKSHKRHVMK